MTSTSEDLILPPSVDPLTKKLGIRNVTGHNAAGTRTEIKVRDFDIVVTDEPDTMGGTNTAPSPLETVLVALVGCDGVIINGVAQAMKFDYSGVDFDCTSQIDIRGPKGVKGVRPYFEKVDITLTLYTDEPPERVAKLQANVENRCPVMNLMRDAGVELTAIWKTLPKQT
jgi:uncharacterized OsmC-like protein